MRNKGELPNIGILTFPIGKAGNIPLSNLIDVVYPLSNELYLITGNDGYTFFKEDKRIHTYGIRHEGGANGFTRILNYIYTQVKISYKLARLMKDVDFWIFFIGGDTLPLPMLAAKLSDRKVMLALAGSSAKVAEVRKDLLFKPLNILKNFNYTLSDGIIVYTKNLIKEFNLGRYRNKIYIAHKHFIDFDKFKIKKRLDERDNLVGYIGSISKAKGILNFVQAIQKILERRDDIKFLVGGDGHLRGEIEQYLEAENLNNKVKLAGWISHDKLPEYLNELKLVVLPSYTEGLPNLMLEAMACGTPVLATPVGAIPDVIKDGETGFILEDNSPACIAENVMRALEHPDLERIVKNARAMVEREFTYEAAVEKYKKIIEEF